MPQTSYQTIYQAARLCLRQLAQLLRRVHYLARFVALTYALGLLEQTEQARLMALEEWCEEW